MNLFAEAAELLSRRPPPGVSRAGQLLRELDYLESGDDVGGRELLRARVALLRAAATLSRVFTLSCQDAPGLVFVGAESDPAVIGPQHRDGPRGSAAGSGMTLAQAFESCIGESVEYLSQFEIPGDLIDASEPELASPDPLPEATGTPYSSRGASEWVRGHRVGDGAPVRLPADRCLRRAGNPRAPPPSFALGTGCAAGPSIAAATVHAVLELIERDAASLWWQGGRRGRPIALEGPAARAGAERLAALRRGRTERRTWLLDITTELGVPCAAALSVRPDGRGLACGLAARTTMTAALEAALAEMCHIELAYEVVAAKRAERGDAALNEVDRRHLRRETGITADCPLLHPQGIPEAWLEAAEPAPETALLLLQEKLRHGGFEAYVVDLTRPVFGIPVVRAVVPGLQLAPSQVSGERLRRTIAMTGGGEVYTRGVSLL